MKQDMASLPVNAQLNLPLPPSDLGNFIPGSLGALPGSLPSLPGSFFGSMGGSLGAFLGGLNSQPGSALSLSEFFKMEANEAAGDAGAEEGGGVGDQDMAQ